MKRVTVILSIYALMVPFVGISLGDIIPIEDFKDLIGEHTYAQTLRNYVDYENQIVYNLEWKDPNTGIIGTVPKIGFFRLGVIKYFGASAYVVGYANTNNYNSNTFPGWEGYLFG
jgi:hypothetical protein